MQYIFKAKFWIKGVLTNTQKGLKTSQIRWTVDSAGQRNC